MYTHRLSSTVLALALAFAIGCTDSPSTPEEIAAPDQTQLRELGERELLLAVLAKLEALEARFDAERGLAQARMDSLMTAAGIVMARAPGGGNGAGQENAGGNSADMALLVNRTDSLMILASFLAEDAAKVWQGFELCGQFDVKGEAALKTHAAGDMRGYGGLGVDMGTGAVAQLGLGTMFALEFDAGAELGVGLEGCADLSNVGAQPPVRAGTPALMAAAAAPQLQTVLIGPRDQLGLTEQNLERAVTSGTVVLRTGDVGRIGEMASALPVPTAFRDPIGLIRGRIASFDPIPLLCGGSFPTRLAAVVSQGCSFIQNNDLPELQPLVRLGSNISSLTDGFSDLGENFEALVDDVDLLDGRLGSLDSRFGGVCSRMNTIVDRRLRVDVDMPWSNDRVLDVRLFPTDWRVLC